MTDTSGAGEAGAPIDPREKFYDDEVAPLLLKAAIKANERSMSIIAHVEWSKDGAGTTRMLASDASFAARMVLLATQCRGNFDQFCMALMKHGREHGHNSIYLERLGVPAEPRKG